MNNLNTLTQELLHKKRALDTKIAERSMLQTRKTDISTEMQGLSELMIILDKVTALLNSIGEDKQQDAQEKIEGIVTKGLTNIFGNAYSFHILQTMRGKNASVEFFIRTQYGDEIVESPILDAHGGGLAAVVGFMLRVTVMLLDRGAEKSNVMILDESFGMLSESFQEPLGQFVRELVDKTGIQVILITHQPEWVDYADKTYRFGNKSGATYAIEEFA